MPPLANTDLHVKWQRSCELASVAIPSRISYPTKALSSSPVCLLFTLSQILILCSVTKYSRKTAPATLRLVHDHPQGNNLEAFVDVDLLLSTLKSNETQEGEWVHVIGYIKPKQDSPAATATQVFIQAIVLWSACPLKLDGYEKCLDQRKAYDDG